MPQEGLKQITVSLETGWDVGGAGGKGGGGGGREGLVRVFVHVQEVCTWALLKLGSHRSKLAFTLLTIS